MAQEVTQGGDSLEARKQRIRLLFEEIITHNRLELADDIFAPDFYWSQCDLRGPEGVRLWVQSFREAFPDVLDMVQSLPGTVALCTWEHLWEQA